MSTNDGTPRTILEPFSFALNVGNRQNAARKMRFGTKKGSRFARIVGMIHQRGRREHGAILE